MRYRQSLPQLADDVFVTDSGLETTLVFDHGIDLPLFASFPLLGSDAGIELLRTYYATHAEVAVQHRIGCVLDAPTWRASIGWGRQLGFDAAGLDEINRRAVALLEDTRRNHERPGSPIVIDGVVGPRGDGYQVGEVMSAEEAEDYHRAQVTTFADTAADLVSAVTMTYVDEAIGIARAAQRVAMPVSISFTVEADGSLPDGSSLGSAVTAVDAATDGYPAYYLINCAHPTHFETVLHTSEPWIARLRGIRTNGSALSHAELDAAEELHCEDPAALAAHLVRLRRANPQLTVLGGCCGTDRTHIDAIARTCVAGADRPISAERIAG